MERIPPEGSQDFEDLMVSVDRGLVQDGFSIPQRPINALGALSRQYSMSLPITPPIPNAKHEADNNWPISERVYKWYDMRYGERTKIDCSPGRMVVFIEEDLWVIKFPRIYGSVEFTVSRTTESDRSRSDGKPAIYNVLDAIQDFPKTRRTNLPEMELHHIFEKFLLGLESFSILEGSNQNDLIKSAIADVSSAVNHLLDPSKQYGLSKWSSLQAAEKVLKAAITLHDGNYSNTHDLTKLMKQAAAVGIFGQWEELIDCIQCPPAIRYGDNSCSRDEALLAHNSMLGLVIVLSRAGAKFTSNIAL